MYLHEFQTKLLLNNNNILVPKSYLINKDYKVEDIIKFFSNENLVIKAQIHSGSRFKYGGIIFSKNEFNILNKNIKKLLGQSIKTNQTDFNEKKIEKLLIEEVYNIENEIYLSYSLDTNVESIVLLISYSGGYNVEQQNHTCFLKLNIDLLFGPCDYQIREILFFLKLEKEYFYKLKKLIVSLFNIFIKNNMLLLEINPLIIIDTNFICLDAKAEIDDNALCKNKELIKFYDPGQEEEIEAEAKKYSLSYISLKGNIGCMVNGAGLAMATMDLIKFHGGEPANFLDIGGDATDERVFQAIRIILLNKNIKCIFINIFGGIVRCDLIANSLISTYKKLNISIPCVVRLVGNMSREALDIISKSDCSISTESNFLLAIEKVIKLSGE